MENELNNVSNEENEENVQQLQNQPKTKFRNESALFGFLLIFSLVFLLSFYFLNIFVTPIKVVGSSMQPTINSQILNDEDEEHCDVVYFKAQNSYENGEIIIMTNPNKKYIDKQSVNYLIKRIIARPGDTIKFIPSESNNYFIDSKLYYTIEVYNNLGNLILNQEDYIKEDMFYYNNSLVYEKYLSHQTFSQIFNSLIFNQSTEFVIPENQYFVMGDNRNNSTDSRVFGCVAYEDIAGSVKLQVPYGKTLIESLFTKTNLLLERCI